LQEWVYMLMSSDLHAPVNPWNVPAIGRPGRAFLRHRNPLAVIGTRAMPPVVLALLFLGIAVYAGREAGRDSGALGPAVCFAVLTIGMLVWAYRVSAFRRGIKRAWVGSEGMAWEDRRTQRILLWRDVAALYNHVDTITINHVPVGKIHRYVLTLAGGAPVELDDSFPDVADLAALVDEITADRLEPAMRAQLAAGQAVGFGPLGLCRGGVVLGGGVVPWSAVKEVTVGYRQLLVKRAHSQLLDLNSYHLNVPMSQVPNLGLCLRLCASYASVPANVGQKMR
jgi:hypothetical protein